MKKTSICAISDTHGHIPESLPDADILIIAGDFTANDTFEQNREFFEWVSAQKHKHKVLVPGNHDVFIEGNLDETIENIKCFDDNIHLLVDEGLTVEGLKIWGCPWTITFPGINPDCTAFTVPNETAMLEKLIAVPDDIDILVTHTPPYGILDQCTGGGRYKRVGSQTLRRVIGRVRPKACFFGHIHSDRGSDKRDGIEYHNVAFVNERYQPHDIPIEVIEIEPKTKAKKDAS